MWVSNGCRPSMAFPLPLVHPCHHLNISITAGEKGTRYGRTRPTTHGEITHDYHLGVDRLCIMLRLCGWAIKAFSVDGICHGSKAAHVLFWCTYLPPLAWDAHLRHRHLHLQTPSQPKGPAVCEDQIVARPYLCKIPE